MESLYKITVIGSEYFIWGQKQAEEVEKILSQLDFYVVVEYVNIMNATEIVNEVVVTELEWLRKEMKENDL